MSWIGWRGWSGRTGRTGAVVVQLAALAGLAAGPAPEPLSDRIVSYRIAVSLDPNDHTLDAEEVLSWRNATTRPVEQLQFHLYMNAFKNDRSTFMKESRGVHRGHRLREGEWGYIDVLSMRLQDGTDLRPRAEFIHPDDDNEEDETVLLVPLPAPVLPGESITLDIAFQERLPRIFARTGYKGEFHLVGQWFPKIGVLEESGWNCHQFHDNSEFFADYGTFDVSITVPSRFVVGATGSLVGQPVDHGDGTKTYHYVQGDVHDFAWTADPRFIPQVRYFRYEQQRDAIEEQRVARVMGLAVDSDRIRLGDVEVTFLVQPEHVSQIDRHFAAIFNALRYFGYWYGRYPYATLTVVDPAYGARGAGGMEYPTFITAGTRYFAPAGRQSPEGVTIHEFGHQYFYGMVGSNEFEEAFLDEGFNTYATGHVLEKAYGQNQDMVELAPGIPYLGVPLVDIPRGPDPREERPTPRGFDKKVEDFLFLRPFGPSDDLALNAFRDLPFLNYVSGVPIDQVTAQRRRYLRAPKADQLARRSWEYVDRTSYGLNSYARTALMLRTLEGILGRDMMLRVMRTYFQRYKFHHPTVADFISTVNEVAGRSLDDYFDQAIFSSNVMDYAVTDLSSEHPAPGRGVFGGPANRRTVTQKTADEKAEGAEGEAGATYESEVLVRRLGEFTWPQTIAMQFEDSPPSREEWDGRYRWIRYKKTGLRLEEARVDPEETMALDVNRSNNSRSRERNSLAGLKWWSRVLQWMQHVLYFYSGVS